MTTTRASEMDNLRSVVRFRPDQSGLTGRTGRTVRTGPQTALDPYPVGGRRRPHGGQMSTTTTATPLTVPERLAAEIADLRNECERIRHALSRLREHRP